MEMIIFSWVVLSLVVGAFSRKKGGSFLSGFVFALILSPLIAALIVAARRPQTETLEKRELATGKMKKCPHCAEVVKAEAKTCKHCGKDLPQPMPKFKTRQEYEKWKKAKMK